METRIFDRETLLDLVVNVIPLGIILFFVVAFLVVNPFGFDPLASGLQFALLVAPFVALAVLTYLSGRAIAGDEKRSPVFVPGQASVRGAKPVEGEHGSATEADQDRDEAPAISAGESGDEAADAADGAGSGEADGTDDAPVDPDEGTDDAPVDPDEESPEATETTAPDER